MRESSVPKAGLISVVALGLLLGCVLGGCDLLPWWNPPVVPTSIYAATVTATDVCTGGNDYCDGLEAVGPPDETSPWTGHFVSLGGGHIIATMEQCFTNGEGADLLVYEVGGVGQGGVAEPFDVFVSSDLITWIPVATEVRNDLEAVFSSIELSPLSGSYRYVKLVDQGLPGGRTPGADIDALEARYAIRCIDPGKGGPIHLGVRVRTAVVDLRVREDPRLDGKELGKMYKGNSGIVKSGPVICSSSLVWWEIEYDIGVSGWSAQATATGTTCLEPLPDLPPPPEQFAEWGWQAVFWAQARVEGPEDQPAWYGWCARFAANAFINTAARRYQDGTSAGGHADDLFQELDRWDQGTGGWASAPNGSLVFFGRTETNEHGHVGIYLGGGDIIHAWGRVKVNAIQDMLDGAEAGTEEYEGIGQYIGWAYPPERWRPESLPSADSLVAYYDFNAAVMTTLVDNSQYMNSGDIQDISGVVVGKVGNAFSFDGDNDWVRVPDSESLRGIREFAISCWVNPASLPPAGRAASTGIVAYGKEWQGMWELRLMGDGSPYLLLNWNTSSEVNVYSSSQLAVGTWHHVVATFDGAIARVYLDGELAGEEPCIEILHPGEGSYMAIGLDFPGANEYFHGLIDELWIYNEVVGP